MRTLLLLVMVVVLSFASGCAENASEATSGTGEPGASEALKSKGPTGSQLAPQDPSEVIATLKNRLKRLRNVVVDYEVKTTYPPLRPGEVATTRPEGASFTITRVTGIRVWEKRFMLLDTSSRYDERITIVEGAAQGPDWRPETEVRKRTYRDDGGEYLGLGADDKPLRGVLYPARRLPAAEIEIALALRAHRQTDRLYPEALEGMGLHLPDSNTAVLRAKDNEQYTHEWTFDRRYGYALLRYHRIPPSGKWTHHEAVMSDFRDAGGLILPYSILLTSKTMRGGTSRTNLSSQITVKSYRLDDPENTADRYRIDFPPGTAIRDRRPRPPGPTTVPASALAPVAAPATRPASVPTTAPAASP